MKEENLKIGMYTENDYFELFEEHNFLGRSMYDAIFDKIHAQITEIEQLKSNLKQKDKEIERLSKEVDMWNKKYNEQIDIINGMEKFFKYEFDNEVRPLNSYKISVWTICLDKLKELKGE